MESVPFLAPGIGTRISEAAKLLGVRKSASAVLNISAATLQRYVSEENMPPFDVAARLCAAAGVRMEWLAFDQLPMLQKDDQKTAQQSGSQPVRYDVLRVALRLAEELAEGKVLSTEDRAELVGLIYEMHEEGLPEAKILRFARAAVK